MESECKEMFKRKIREKNSEKVLEEEKKQANKQDLWDVNDEPPGCLRYLRVFVVHGTLATYVGLGVAYFIYMWY